MLNKTKKTEYKKREKETVKGDENVKKKNVKKR